MIKKLSSVGLILLSLFLTSCKSEEVKYMELKGRALGTTFSIKYKDNEKRDFSQNINFIYDKINRSLSTYSNSSDISRINRGEVGVEVDDNFINVFRAAKILYNDTNGVLDPTIGVLVNAWGFGPGKKV